MKVLLLTSPRPESGTTPLHFGDNRFPQGLGFLAAYIESHGHEVRLIDLYSKKIKEGSNYTDIVEEKNDRFELLDL